MKRNMTGKTAAIVLAGGRGKRMNSDVHKQYLQLDGKPLIVYALEAFEAGPVDEIVLVTGAEEAAWAQQEIVRAYGFHKVCRVVAGGSERYHSVYEGLKALDGRGCEIVLIHDGARPLVTTEIIERAVDGVRKYGACVAGMPVKDTIKKVDAADFALETPDRNYLWQIQTPQAFSYDLVRTAYDRLMEEEASQAGITDDAMVVEQQTDHKVKLIRGSYENLKVTTPEDLILAEALLKSRLKK